MLLQIKTKQSRVFVLLSYFLVSVRMRYNIDLSHLNVSHVRWLSLEERNLTDPLYLFKVMARATMYLFASILLTGAYNCDAYKILMIFPMPNKSYLFLGKGMTKHLLEARHEVIKILLKLNYLNIFFIRL